MGFKTEEAIDSSVVANELMQDIIEVDRVRQFMSPELSSEDLFRIDCGILSSLKNTQDFSRELISLLENGRFEAFKPRTIENELQAVQQQVMADITLPLQNMFDELVEFVEL